MKYNRYALTLLLSIMAFCFSSTRSSAQITILADPTTCGDTSLTLHATLIGDVPTSAGITSDDGYSSVINIGFTFNFYGNNYTQLVIGSNGVLCFNTSSAGAYCPWPISAPLLGNASVRNCFCGPWSDIYIPAGGTITYSSIGTAPFRKFMVTFCATHMYSCTAQYETFQMILYETTNVCETHIAHRTTGCSWNGGYAIVGVQNSTGTAATAAPSRDYPTLWGCINEAWRFTPSGSPISSYVCSSIPFAPVPYASSTIYWYDSATHMLVGTGPVLTAHPTVPTTYVAVAAGCSDSTFAYYHALPVGSGGGTISAGSHPVHITSLLSSNPTECGLCNGSVTLTGVNPYIVDTIFYSIGGVAQPVIIDSAASDSTLVIGGLCAGSYDYFYVKEGDCVSNAIPTNLTAPVLTAGFTLTAHPGCSGDSVIITNTSTPVGAGVSVFSFGDGVIDSSSPNPTHIYATQGAYNITLVYHNAYGCSSSFTSPVTFYHPLSSSFTPSSSAVCLGSPINFTNSSVGNAPTYLWSFGDGTTSTLMNPTHMYMAPGDYTVTLAVTDSVPCTAVSSANVRVVSIAVTTDFHDTTVCLLDSLNLISHVTVIPSSVPVGYLWSPASNLGNPSAANPNFLGTGNFTYTVTATAVGYGCTASDVLQIHNNPPVASFTPSATDACLGVPIIFNNYSSGMALTYNWTFGDGYSSTAVSPSHVYPAGGDYVANLVVTDSLGCVRTATASVEIVSINVRSDIHDTNVCLRIPMPITTQTEVVPSSTAVTYSWTPGTNLSDPYSPNPTFWGIGDFIYTLTATTSPLGCTASDVMVIHAIPPMALANVTADATITLGSSIQLNADSAWIYTWSPDNGTLDNPNINNPVATPTDSVTTYMVVGMSHEGCRDTAYVTIRVDQNTVEFVPAGFTPNGDGLNDVFRPYNLHYQKLVDFRVFNRWGKEVYQTIDPKSGWDGKYNGVPQDMGTYYYQIIVARPDGEQKTYTGSVTLIR